MANYLQRERRFALSLARANAKHFGILLSDLRGQVIRDLLDELEREGVTVYWGAIPESVLNQRV